LALGALFLSTGIEKYHEGWLSNPEPLHASLAGYEKTATGYHLTYLDQVALPYAFAWSKLICIGATALGASLLLGCFVRLLSFIGIILVLNLYAANGSLYSLKFFGTPWSVLIFTSLVILFLARAGRWGGIDALFAKSNSKGLLW
jgi:uncharacterized membrane protein YphA (DoxX/SURF4 family)